MINSFQSILNDIDKHHQSLEWTTDSGYKLNGVLHAKDGRVVLNVNPKGLEEAIHFEFLYHENIVGGRRILYPYDVSSSKYIPAERVSEVWPIEIFVCEDESPRIKHAANKITSFIFESFLWYKVPDTKKEQSHYQNQIKKVQGIETSVGKFSFSLYGEESFSNHPSKTEKSMDKIHVSIERDESFSNNELLMWHARLSQFLTLIHKERVVIAAIQRGFSNTLVPHLSEDYSSADYAYRQPVSLEEFVKVVEACFKNFIEKYDEIAPFIEDLIVYYRDYPLDPPDKIQLLRLFTSLEQCANYAQKREGILNRDMTKDQVRRKKEFNSLLAEIKTNPKISLLLKDYLRNTKQFFVTSGSTSTPKYKIHALAQFIQKKYGIFLSLSNLANVELSLKMRNVVAHGFFDPMTEATFYEKRDPLGQDIEKILRAYVFRVLGAKPKDIEKLSEPLKARQFNSY